MKTFNYKSFAAWALVLFMGTGLVSCKDDAKYSVLRGQAYIEQTNTKGNASKGISVADGELGRSEISVRLSDVFTEDAKFELVVDPSVLDAYNKQNASNLKVLPEAQRRVSATEVVVKAGATSSAAVKLEIDPLSDEQKDSGEKFAIPFRLKSKDGKVAVLPGADEFVYIVRPVIVTVAPVLGSDRSNGYTYNGFKATGVEEVPLSAWTVEFRVNMNGFGRNNQALFGNWGKDSEIYIRFGDAGTPFNTLQVKFGDKGQFDRSNMVFTPNTWYHIAVVYDGTKATLYVNGQKDLDTDKPAGKVFNLGNGISVANSGSQWFVNAAMMSEMRVWNIARTPQQLVENEFSVSPKTPGLLHYWKMNEGKGNELKNSISGAPSLLNQNSGGNVRWVDNIRSDGKGRNTSDK